MATTKKAATTATTEKKTATKKAATATTEKKTATKAATKATAEKKAPAKKPAAKKTTAKVDLYIQFGGATVAVADIEKNVKKVVKGKKAYTVYVKPEESKAYIVADGETTGMDVFFCE
ncbi:MAG: hypothetical protein IJE16_01750 [Ruminococcus sp.]|nr:hypothetical protein [Ruminococcus sp.]